MEAPIAVDAALAPRLGGKRGREWVSPFLISLVALLLVWEAVVRALHIREIILPAPSAIIRSFVLQLASDPRSTHSIYFHFGVTLGEAVAGFLAGGVIGIILGTVIAQFRITERILMPYIVGVQGLPKVALAPLFVVWFGFGFMPKFVLALTATFFPVTINAIAGFKSVEQDRIDMMRSIGASRRQTFTLMSLPAALPFIFAGLEIAVSHAMLAALVGEFVGSSAGLGYLLQNVNQSLDIATEFVVMLLLAAVGIGLYRGVLLVKHRVIAWAPEASQFNKA
ncbi:MAG: ABC transporter permease [Chloroflexi bacterium]|nr:ABC transporter permease [Chloroflexota bacterium]